MKLIVGYPDRDAELAMLDLPERRRDASADGSADEPPPLFGPADVLRVPGRWPPSVRVAPAIKEYVVDLVRATRDPAGYGLDLAPLLELGASPRATIALVRAARGHALLAGRDYVTPARRQEPRPRRPPPPHPRQLRGRRRGPVRRRPPPRILDHIPVP